MSWDLKKKDQHLN